MKSSFLVFFIAISIGLVSCSTLGPQTAITPLATSQIAIQSTIEIPAATGTPLPSITPEPQATPLTSMPVPPGLIYTMDTASCQNKKGTWITRTDGQPVLITKYTWITFSPDHKRAIGDGCGENNIIEIKTGKTHAINKDAWGFSWSTNGRYLFYQKDSNDIWVLDTQTNKEQRFTNTPNRIESSPEPWKANSDTLLFYSWGAQEDCCGEGWVGYLSSIKIDGSQYSVISNSPLNGAPAISPIGPSIIYNTHNYDASGKYSVKTLFFHLGRGSQPFPFENYGLAQLGNVNLLSPSWSPDGKYLAGWLSGKKNDEYFNAIVIINWETGQSKTFFHLGDLYNGPSSVEWSLDGEYITFYTRLSDKEKYGIWVWNVDEQSPFQLIPLETEADTCDKVWSPDTKWMALSCDDPAIEPGTWLIEVGKWKPTRTTLPVEAKIQEWVDYSIFVP